MNYLKCDYMLRHGKGRHEAVVTGMIPAGVFVALKDIAVDGFIHISNLGWGYYEVDLENRRMSFVLESNLERRLIKGGKGGSRRSSRRGSRLYGRKFDPFDIDDDDFDELFGQKGDDDWDD